MSLVYSAVGLLVAAQLVGLYALISRKADFIFALVVVILLAVALAMVGDFTFSHFHIHLSRFL